MVSFYSNFCLLNVGKVMDPCLKKRVLGVHLLMKRAVAKFIVPDWGDKVGYRIGLSYGGPVRQPYA